MEWRWADVDGKPAAVGEYIVALPRWGRILTLYWDGQEWKKSQYMAPYEHEVIAWAALPGYPMMPENVLEIRKRKGKS